MAVFLINICKFNGCGITFPSLGDLIQHIEDTHIDYDPKVVEQKEQAQPACLPLSYVLRFISDAARKESPFLGSPGVELKRKLAIKHHSYSLSSSNRSNTPTGSELDEDEMIVSESEDSNDSWTTEEFSSEFIMRYGSRHSGSSNGTPGNEKPFACPVPGCKKRYKNVNGIKYHSKNGHKKDGKVRKGYKCHCGKSYKTAQGLKSHALVAHNASPDNVTNVMVRSTSPSQSLGSLSPSSISNMSSSNGSCNNINQSTNGNCITQAPPPPPSIQQQQQQQQHQQQQQTQSQNQQINHLTNGGNIQQHQQHTSIATANSIQQSVTGSATVAAANHLMRGNIGLISIKSSSKPNATNLIAANVTASKILKLAAASAAASNNNENTTTTAILENGKLKFEACTTASTSTTTPTAKTMTLPNLVNLGILTPATSPNNKSQHTTTTFQTSSGGTVTTCGGVSVLSTINLNSSNSSSPPSSVSCTASSSSTSSSATSSSSSSQSLSNPNNNITSLSPNNNGQHHDQQNNNSLPLTPISPNVVQQAQKTVTVASVATGTTNGGGLTISTNNIVGSIHLATASGSLEET